MDGVVDSERMKSSRRLYGSKVQFQDTTGPLGRPSRLPFLLELALAATGLLLGFHARILVAWRQFTISYLGDSYNTAYRGDSARLPNPF